MEISSRSPCGGGSIYVGINEVEKKSVTPSQSRLSFAHMAQPFDLDDLFSFGIAPEIMGKQFVQRASTFHLNYSSDEVQEAVGKVMNSIPMLQSIEQKGRIWLAEI